MSRKYFFGWENWKWLFKECLKIYSSEKSFFSKKRVESNIAFMVAEMGAIYWLTINAHKINAQDFAVWISLQLAMCGYLVYQTQRQKRMPFKDDLNDT